MKKKASDKIAIDMTPMIDIVFQLLTFFVMTLKIATAEGDFQIRMPLAVVDGPTRPELLPPILVRLQSNESGECTRVQLAETEFSGSDRWERVHQRLAAIVGEGSLRDTAEVELQCDPQLKYEHAIAAITAISGRLDPRSGETIKLIEKIKFSPPRT
ncbi:ExbD/TolR family protein [Anatilimnocola sp. NA78]|uniref:ExbD/TolR family protein n=1 Tax=Anatilimnocola sp. NA78 TaxID=3415683 RepID=UPI003CE574DB